MKGETFLKEETKYVELDTQKKSGHEYAVWFPVPSPELGEDPESHGGVVEKLENCRQSRRKEWADIGGPRQQKMGIHQIQGS